MTSVLARYPDIVRYARSELKAAKLMFGAVICLVVGICLLATVWTAGRPALTFFQYILGLQAIILLGYGTARTAGSVIAERQEGTWDLQRLTPLTPMQLAAGKLLGAPVFAAYLAAALLPFALACFLFPTPLEPAVFLRGYAALAAGTFMALSIGLVISAYSAEAVGGAYSSATGSLAGIFAVQAFLPVLAMSGEAMRSTIPFYGLALPPSFMWALSACALGLWAFLSAKWRIGTDLLEGPRWWRLPAFLAFVVFYEFGLVMHQPHFPLPLILLPPALFVYLAAVLNAEDSDHWKRWLGASEPQGRWHRVPVWLNGCESYLVLALAFFLISPGRLDREWTLYPLLQSAFMARDLMFLQWCRLKGYKRPEYVALVCLAFAYALPAVVIGSLQVWAGLFIYVPVPNAEYGAVANLGPALVQAGLMGWVLARRLRGAVPHVS